MIARLFRYWGFLAIILLGSYTLIHAAEPKQSLVWLQVYQQKYDLFVPWNKKQIERQRGMAIVLPGQRLLTTADLVKNPTLLEVYLPKTPEPYPVEVELSDSAFNLALLKVNSKEFWQQVKPFEWGEARPGEAKLYQWTNPNTWESGTGKLNKLMIQHREESGAHQPVFQVETSLKTLGSGAALVQKQKLVGLVQELKNGQAWAIPGEFLQNFIARAQRPSYESFALRGFNWQPIPQKAIREALKIPTGQTGIWVTRVMHEGTGADVLQVYDFIVKIEGLNISNEGTIRNTRWGEVSFDTLWNRSQEAQAPFRVEVIRQGQRLTLNTQARDFPPEKRFIPLPNERPTRYVLRGGLLFQELTLDYLQAWGKEWNEQAPVRLRMYWHLESALPQNRDRHIVLLTRVLPDPLNIGYQELNNMVVTSINGHSINRLEDVVQAFHKPEGEFHLVDFLPGFARHHLVLSATELEAANRRVLENFQIPSLERL